MVDSDSQTAGPEAVVSGRAGTRRGVEGERRIVTVLFCDVAGSTAMAEQLDPEEWTEVMNEAFEFLIAPVQRYEGTVARLMGDAILAFFGAPTAHEEDPQRAVMAGLEIVEGIEPFRESIKQDYGLDFDVRVGINTGPVVVGDVGTQAAGEYTAMGDAVNVASRMEQTAERGTVQISESTYALVSPLFDLDPIGSIEVKGKTEPVLSYRVTGRKAQPGRLRGIEGLSSPVIGRSAETETLRTILDEVREGRGHVVSLMGEAGLGKSRLIEETRQSWQDASPSLTWTETRGVSYDSSRPYGLFLQQLRQICGAEEGDSADVIREKIATNGDLQPEAQSLLARALELLSTAGPGPDETQLEGQAVKNEIFDVVLRFWQAVLNERPGVVVFDDIHWADPASVELLVHLLQLSEEAPVLFLCALRPERQSAGWKIKQAAEADYPHRYTELMLSPLSDDDSDALVNNLLAVADMPDELRRLILGKADGNPFFVEEIVRTLIDSGAVVQDDTGMRWRATTRVDSIDIPSSLQALLVSRFDRLEEEARKTLQLASVIGRSFYYQVLELVSDTATALDRQLSTLQRVELIREGARVPDLEYAFRHELTRDAAYHSILSPNPPKDGV